MPPPETSRLIKTRTENPMLMLMIINASGMPFLKHMNTYPIEYHKNAVVARFIQITKTKETMIAPIKCPLHLMNVRFTVHTPIVTELIMRGMVLSNSERPNQLFQSLYHLVAGGIDVVANCSVGIGVYAMLLQLEMSICYV